MTQGTSSFTGYDGCHVSFGCVLRRFTYHCRISYSAKSSRAYPHQCHTFTTTFPLTSHFHCHIPTRATLYLDYHQCHTCRAISPKVPHLHRHIPVSATPASHLLASESAFKQALKSIIIMICSKSTVNLTNALNVVYVYFPNEGLRRQTLRLR